MSEDQLRTFHQTGHVTVTLRLATSNDIPAALRLCRISGWNQLETDWTRLLEYEPGGCFAAEVDSELVGTVTTTRYGTSLAWIGMMLVHPEFRRRGIATMLMNRSLQYLQACGVRCIKLDATPEGQHVYERLGFTAEWSLRRWTQVGSDRLDSQRAKVESQQPCASSLARYLEMDRRGFGADRSQWIQRLLPDSKVRCRNLAIGLLRPGFLASYLGPLIASGLGDAKTVIEELIDDTVEPVFWDIPDPNRAAVDLANELQFRPVRELTRMRMGSNPVESDLRWLLALADPSTG